MTRSCTSFFAFTLCATAVLLVSVSAVRTPVATKVGGPVAPATGNVGDPNFLCTLCLFASAEADKKLHLPETYAAFKKYVEDKVCTAFRLVERILCKKVAPKLIPAIYEWAEKFLETGRACGAFCHGSDTVNSTCSMCEFGCQSINQFLSKPENDNKTLAFAEGVCPLFSPELQPKCAQDIMMFGPEVIDFIMQVTSDPRDTCNKLKFCLAPNETVALY
ncbi:hypothetical protein HOP50_04g29830 [Chloropicon primus]|uniref:Saposin B-type domain-containing protein n=1 Tax=Chloropicon primus TaxID=1764295 RepID=A0A5B8MIY3_9CHLO|nr:hypothetical protein A3770_04p29840 [Chloropicon primus]UPQ99675.1 hypothetical protein HOP50_04g29830 [Chloropicon primus]|eukprot:QDZ20466.1 hypothetical protein A3770_04p29840 [Chloropicon primus]